MMEMLTDVNNKKNQLSKIWTVKDMFFYLEKCIDA